MATTALYYFHQGNEGIEVKEGTVETLIEGNEVYMQYDAESGGESERRGQRDQTAPVVHTTSRRDID